MAMLAAIARSAVGKSCMSACCSAAVCRRAAWHGSISRSATAHYQAVGVGRPASRHSHQQRQQRAGLAATASAPDASGSSSSAAGEAAAAEPGAVCSQRCELYDVPGELAEEVAEVLLAYGAQTSSIEEYRPEGAPEQEIFHYDDGSYPAGEGPRVWDRCTVVAHLPPDADAAGLLGAVAGDFNLAHLQRSVALVHMQDWQQSIRDSYVPSQVCEGLWIVPSWSQAPEPAEQGGTAILLEPGLAFGTGDHPTTRLCLRWLRDLQRDGQLAGASLMDYGTGSGVLAVAALLMGAGSAVGTDIDPLAVKAAAQNAALNGVEGRLQAFVCAGSAEASAEVPAASAGGAAGGAGAAGEQEWQRRRYDITVANILQGPLLQLAPALAALTRPGGRLGLSGILQEQAEAVVQGYSHWFEGFQVTSEERWALVTAVRRRDE